MSIGCCLWKFQKEHGNFQKNQLGKHAPIKLMEVCGKITGGKPCYQMTKKRRLTVKSVMLRFQCRGTIETWNSRTNGKRPFASRYLFRWIMSITVARFGSLFQPQRKI